jgi:hypothetical protein
VQVAPKPGEAWVTAVSQFHFEQVEQFGAGLEFHRHVVMKNPHSTLGFDPPQPLKLRCQIPWI